MSTPMAGESRAGDVGVVVIGRNEGERLRQCLLSLQDVANRVYVDSGSTDGSQDLARGLGFEVVEISTPPGFTAARARNAGLQRLLEIAPSLTFVQMVDGDCEMAPGWIATARAALEAEASLAVVFGRRRERYPDATIYNMMCDDEWDVPLGEAGSCGGDALFRVAPLVEVGGYANTLIAGEEPDLCLRLRQRGWKVQRISAEMTVHDAAIHRFSQWWRRAQRAGHAYAELTFRHGPEANPTWIRQLSSTLLWAGVGLSGLMGFLASLLFSSWLPAPIAAIGTVLFILQGLRIAWRRTRQGMPARQAFRWASLIMVAKFAELHGMLQFHARRLSGRHFRLIEYKA